MPRRRSMPSGSLTMQISRMFLAPCSFSRSTAAIVVLAVANTGAITITRRSAL